jgi:hypothetical protein
VTKFLREQLKGGKVHFGSQFQSLVICSIDSGPVVRQSVMVEVWGKVKCHLLVAGEQKEEGFQDSHQILNLSIGGVH